MNELSLDVMPGEKLNMQGAAMWLSGVVGTILISYFSSNIYAVFLSTGLFSDSSYWMFIIVMTFILLTSAFSMFGLNRVVMNEKYQKESVRLIINTAEEKNMTNILSYIGKVKSIRGGIYLSRREFKQLKRATFSRG